MIFSFAKIESIFIDRESHERLLLGYTMEENA